jgi:hypothetical protein
MGNTSETKPLHREWEKEPGELTPASTAEFRIELHHGKRLRN